MKQAENSDVFRLKPETVDAVVVMTAPTPTAGRFVALQAAFPLPSVLTVTSPRYRWPSPLPEGSHVVELKTWMRMPFVFGVVFSVPVTVSVASEMAVWMTGKFWPRFAPRVAVTEIVGIDAEAAAGRCRARRC